MGSLWMNLGLGLLVLVGAVLLYAATRPDTFAMQRQATIAAPPERIFPLINSLHGFNKWNPFVAPDPAIKIDYYGPDSGVGAGHRWDGNREVGRGSIEIVESNPSSNIVFKLHMQKPMEALNRVEFTLRPNGAGTDVTWVMQGRQPFIGKLVTVFINCDRMVGQQFEKGLASLKVLAEK